MTLEITVISTSTAILRSKVSSFCISLLCIITELLPNRQKILRDLIIVTCPKTIKLTGLNIKEFLSYIFYINMTAYRYFV